MILYRKLFYYGVLAEIAIDFMGNFSSQISLLSRFLKMAAINLYGLPNTRTGEPNEKTRLGINLNAVNIFSLNCTLDAEASLGATYGLGSELA